MVRIRCTAGGITPVQFKKVAGLSKSFGSGKIHATTRQEVQIHDVLLDDIITVLNELLSVGLATRGGGGNTVRNIIANKDSGIDPGEVFDVEPYAITLSSQLISEPDSWGLPRKFKIGFFNLVFNRSKNRLYKPCDFFGHNLKSVFLHGLHRHQLSSSRQ